MAEGVGGNKGDLRYLLKLDDYEVLPDIDTGYLQPVFDDLQDQVRQIGLDKDRKTQVIFDMSKKIETTNVDYLIIQQMLYVLSYSDNKEVEDELSKYGYTIDPNKDRAKELKRISKRSKLLLSRISIWKQELQDITKAPDSKLTIWDEIESISKHDKIDIDIYKMSMHIYLIKKHRILRETAKSK